MQQSRVAQIVQFAAIALFAAFSAVADAQSPGGPATVALPGHVLPALSKATRLPRNPLMDQDPLTFSVMLNLSDMAAYDAFLQDFNNPDSPHYRKTISGSEFTSRFGPSPEAYSAVLNYFQQKGFALVVGSSNRRTATFHGTRIQGESAFNLKIDDYQMGSRTFHAIASDPALPADVAPLVAGVSGLSNPGRWQAAATPTPPTPASIAKAYGGELTPAGSTNSGGLPPGIDGSGQTVGIISFYSYDQSYIKAWLKFAGLPASLLSQVVDYTVGTGAMSGGSNEPLIDIESVLGTAPGATVVVYLTPDTDYGYDASDYYTPIAAAVDNMWSTGGIISISYGICELEIAAADATNMDSLLESASSVGVSLFAATGDSGTTCLHFGLPMMPNTIPYPASVPHAIAVGGTSVSVTAGNVYNSEDYWNNSFGSGGYGTSQFFKEPGYQDSFYKGAGGRSIPDVAMDTFPGIITCFTTGALSCTVTWGGTSMAAPMWAGIWAIASQANVDAFGYSWSPAGDYFYKMPDAFHAASTITGGTFADVGLGSPIIPAIIAKGIPPVINNCNPVTGPASGGTKVTITGVGFIGVEKVTFGGVAGTHLSIESDSKLTVETPVAPAEIADVELVTPGGTAKSSSPFTYVPQITGVSPNAGPLDGGITVTVTGLALNDTLAFVFGIPSGGGAATSVKCASSSTSCTMVAPAHAAGLVDIVAVTPWGYGDSPVNPKDQFTYQAPAITSFNPATGPTTGGLFVALTGVGLQDGKTTVSFGGAPATAVSCVGTTYCSMTSPEVLAAGPVHLTATVAGTTSAPSGDEFTFVVFPTLTGISPGSGAAGSTVTLTGTGFSTVPGQTTFSFWGQSATGVSCTSTTQCTAVVPGEGETTGSFVTVTVNGNTSLDGVDFSYTTPVPPPGCKGTMCQ